MRYATRYELSLLVMGIGQRYDECTGHDNGAGNERENASVLGKINELKDGVQGKYRSKIRERAITQAKARIALSERRFEDFTEDELEIIVKDEEDKVKRSLKQTGVVALLITLGLA